IELNRFGVFDRGFGVLPLAVVAVSALEGLLLQDVGIASTRCQKGDQRRRNKGQRDSRSTRRTTGNHALHYRIFQSGTVRRSLAGKRNGQVRLDLAVFVHLTCEPSYGLMAALRRLKRAAPSSPAPIRIRLVGSGTA